MNPSTELRALEGEIAEINGQPLPVSTNRKNTKRKAALCDVLLTIAKELEKERDELTETKKTNEHLERRLQVAENTIRGTTDQYHLTRKERDSLRIERDTISRFNETNRKDAESLKSQLVDALAENATLKRRLDEAMKELEVSRSEKQNNQMTDDELLARAIEAIRAEGKASVSFIQRRFCLGYLRAQAIMHEMECRGIVAPPKPANPHNWIILKPTP